MSSSSSTSQDFNKNEDFFRYTAGRFLFDEAFQLSSRAVRFDMNELARIAARSVSSPACANVEKLPEGQYNKAFLMTMEDGVQVIAKVPNLGAGLPHFTTASEVATMDFVRNVLNIPAPKVYAWSSHATETPVGAEYILMEKAGGVPLSNKWVDMRNDSKEQLIEAVIGFEKAVTSAKFKMIGSIYYRADLDDQVASQQSSLNVDEKGKTIPAERFSIGPTTDRKFFDDGRGLMHFDRGPWHTAEDYVKAIAYREIVCVRGIKQLPRPLGFFTGSYRPSRENKLSVLQDYLDVAKYLLPTKENVLSSVLWHGDLHQENIFVDPNNPGIITNIIDWQSTHLEPLFLQARPPAFLNFEGPKWEGTEAPVLPDNFDDLNSEEQHHARTLRDQQLLYKLYELQTLLQNNEAYQAMRYRDSLCAQIIALTSNILQDGEPLIKGQLMQLAKDWAKVPAVGGPNGPPCPLKYTEEDALAQEAEQEELLEGLLMMKQVLSALGDADTGWQGWVSHEDYETLKGRLEDIRLQFMQQAPDDPVKRAKWEEAWPFKD